jgi:hypothetical protein
LFIGSKSMVEEAERMMSEFSPEFLDEYQRAEKS